jgi:hypothetical protein
MAKKERRVDEFMGQEGSNNGIVAIRMIIKPMAIINLISR